MTIDKAALLDCPCGGAGYKPQYKCTRINSTHKAVAHVYFCLGGCHREGVGITAEQAADAWNESIKPKAALTGPAPVTDAEVQEALRWVKGLFVDYEREADFTDAEAAQFERHAQTVCRALSRPASGMELPQLPEGWQLCAVEIVRDDAFLYGRGQISYKALIEYGNDFESTGTGPTPRAAAEAAIAKIEKGRG